MSYRNVGFVATDSPPRNYFCDKALQYWKAVETNPYFTIPDVKRIGVRNRCFARVDEEFATIESAMFEFFCRPEVIRFLGGARKDHQIVLISEDGERKTTATFSPLHREEASQLFQFPSEHFKAAGIFIDLDSYVEQPSRGVKGVEEFIRSASDSAWSRIESLLGAMGL